MIDKLGALSYVLSRLMLDALLNKNMSHNLFSHINYTPKLTPLRNSNKVSGVVAKMFCILVTLVPSPYTGLCRTGLVLRVPVLSVVVVVAAAAAVVVVGFVCSVGAVVVVAVAVAVQRRMTTAVGKTGSMSRGMTRTMTWRLHQKRKIVSVGDRTSRRGP